ncbi:MAG: hypothetical protein V1744_06100 [Candidatus Altiarchaeota archaeon]
MDEINFRRWTSLTQQQYDIVKVIYRLRNRGVKPTPKNIQREYRTEHNKIIIKPNLFNILKTLQNKKVIVRAALAEYALDQEGIRGAIEESKQGLRKDVEDCERTQNEIEQFFKELTYRKEQPDIHYLEGEQLYLALADSLEKSDAFYVVTDFPTIAYSREMTHTLGREPYAEKLWQTLKNKKTQMNILTELNMDTLFNHAFRTYGDPKIAYQESLTTIDKLRTQMETHKNLDIRYIDSPHGLGVAIVQQKEPVEFIIFMRDEHNDIQGGIRIRSHRTAANALRTFMHTYEYATHLNSPVGRDILQKTKENLTHKYGVLGE